MGFRNLIILLFSAFFITACGNNYDYPEPTYMDTIEGISLHTIQSVQYYVGPLSHGWNITYANGEWGIIGYDRKQWLYRSNSDSVSRPLIGYGHNFQERYGVTEKQLIQIMDYCRANEIYLLCGPSYVRWEEEYASSIYEYQDGTLHEILMVFDAIDDSIRFDYRINGKDWYSGKRGYARLINSKPDYLEYLYDADHNVIIRFSADTLQCLSVSSNGELGGSYNSCLNSMYPMTRRP